jgi:hypothetical protein
MEEIMSIENVGKTLSFPAGADLSSCQYRVVCLHATAGTVDLPKTAVTAIPIGILQNAPKQNQEAVVALLGCGGVSKAVCNAAINAGVIVALEWVDDVGDSGKVKAAVATQYPIGITLSVSGAEDELTTVLLAPLTVKA